MLSCIKDFLLGKYTWTFLHLVQTIRLKVEHVLLLFSVVHCTIQNLLTFLGKEEINNGKSNSLPNSSPVAHTGMPFPPFCNKELISYFCLLKNVMAKIKLPHHSAYYLNPQCWKIWLLSPSCL